MRKGTRLLYFQSCVGWPVGDVQGRFGLQNMVDTGQEVTRFTFKKHVDLCELASMESGLGYDDFHSHGGMANDYHVTYHRGWLHTRRVYWFRHSAIEYVFTEGGTL